MIIGVILKYIKTYQGINYIPITSKDKFCGLVGNNGIGKSTVLEAFDCLFNDKTWNLNVTTKRSGLIVTNPSIVPIFLIHKSKITVNSEIAETYSNVIWNIPETEIANINRPHFKEFTNQRTALIQNFNIDEYYLLPLGVDYNLNVNISFFNSNIITRTLFPELDHEKTTLDETELNILKPLFLEIKALYQYIYIPKDIDPTTFTKLETKEIQALMGETLLQVLEERVPNKQITEINKSLNDFLGGLSHELEDYSFRTPTDRQQNLRKTDIYNLIIEAFFNIRKLHKKQGDNWLEIGDLSSGEKQKAIIEVTHNLIKNHRDNSDNLIIAVDEPESSLHISACFDHFMKMYEIAESTHQFLFSTHWYGFLPIIEKCSVTAITKKDGDHLFDLVSLENYREAIKQQNRTSKGKLPYDLRLKSLNDFIQSIVSSILDEEPFNWIICEGSSEKIYFDFYFHELKVYNRLRIIPVGGANEIKRIYEHLSVSIDEFKKDLNGKIAFICDTDSELVEFESTNTKNVLVKRLVNINNDTKLINISSNPKAPPTEIEDSLNGKAFNNTLKLYKEYYPELLDFVNLEEDKQEIPSYFAMDLAPSLYKNLLAFFDSDNNKYDFANSYIKELEKEEYAIPNWIIEIQEFFLNEK
ncbi:AAA family ATPase [Flavobacterium sp. NRK F7]|uniref:AAA family ATPase n=1 Tax=Flavobacterium sp. NRK F7 TaxID=2954930 RepID=UPI0020914A46|nr:AAA family ATPase [Flavobacterium sp. NRK F7]MCO6162563.1 ATP-binding protein [Flavobacterium sp. NRK F7]